MRAVRESASPESGTTASAPSRRARACASSDRQTATIRPAPSTRAAPTAAWPTAPPAPSTRTCSPACSRPRQVSAIHAATAESPRAASAGSATWAATGTTSTSGTTQRSAMLPSPGAMPAVVAKKTRVPAGSAAESSTTPTPWTPARTAWRAAEVRSAGGAEEVQRHDRRRGDPDDGVPRRGDRVGMLAERGATPGVVQHGGAHGRQACRRVDVDGVAVNGEVGLHADRPPALLGELPEQPGRAGQEREAPEQLDRQPQVGQGRAADPGAVERQPPAQHLLVDPADRLEQPQVRTAQPLLLGDADQHRRPGVADLVDRVPEPGHEPPGGAGARSPPPARGRPSRRRPSGRSPPTPSSTSCR